MPFVVDKLMILKPDECCASGYTTMTFLVRFSSLDDRDEVLHSGLHMLSNKSIIVKP